MARYPKLSEKIYSERNYLRCKEDWVAHAVELEQAVERLTAERDAAIEETEILAADNRQLRSDIKESDAERRTMRTHGAR